MDASQIGKRAWSYAGVLQDAGLSCFEYVEQLTLLLFLKMADQLTEEPYNRAPIVPPELGWKALLPLDGAALEDQYRDEPRKARRQARHARRHLQGRALRNPQSGAAEAAHRQPARQGGLAVAAGGREGHDLRGIAVALGAGILARRRPVFHHAAGDRGDVRGDAADAGRTRSATRPRAPAASSAPPTTTCSTATSATSTPTRSGRCAKSWSRAWSFRPRSAACAR